MMRTMVVAEKTQIYKAGSKGRRWDTFHCRCAHVSDDVVGDKLYTVFFNPVYYNGVKVGDTFETDAAEKRGAYSVGKKTKFNVVGFIDLGNRFESERVVYSGEKTRHLLELEYISKPRRRRGMVNVVSVRDGKYIVIPASLAASYFKCKEWELSWPNGGFGTLMCDAHNDLNGNIIVDDILSWSPDTRIVSESVKLSDVHFGLNRMTFRLKSGLHHTLYGDDCPFPASYILNEIRDVFSGDLVLHVSGSQTRRGGFKDGRPWSEWVSSSGDDVSVVVDDDVAEKIITETSSAEQRRKWAKGVELIRRLIADEQADINRLIDEMLIFAPEDATRESIKEKIIQECWSEEYEQKYFDRLAVQASEIHPYSDGFVFVIGNAAVVERPITSAATYIFDNPDFPGGISELLRIFAAFPLMTLRQGLDGDETRANVAEKVGLRGVAVHRNYDGWIRKALTLSYYEAETRKEPIIEGDIAAFAALLGVTLTDM